MDLKSFEQNKRTYEISIFHSHNSMRAFFECVL